MLTGVGPSIASGSHNQAIGNYTLYYANKQIIIYIYIYIYIYHTGYKRHLVNDGNAAKQTIEK